MSYPYRRTLLVRELAAKGLSWRAICAQIGCSSASIAKALRQQDMTPWQEAERQAARAALAHEIATARAEQAHAPLYKFRQ